MHGGKSTGPRTPKGFADLAEARTKHGLYTATARATYCYRRKLATRTRTVVAVLRLRAYLPSELEARIAHGPYELVPPPRPDPAPGADNQDNTPCNVARTAQGRDATGRFLARPRPGPTGRQAEREAARQERAMLAPWRAGIKRARLIKRLLKYQDQNARRANRARASLPSPPPGPSPDAGTQRLVGLATGSGSVAAPCHDMTPEPQTQRENPNQDPMQPLTVPPSENPGQDPMQPRAVAPCENPNQDTTQPRAMPPCENPDQHPMQPRTVPHPAGPAGAAGEASSQDPMQPRTVPRPAGPAGTAGEALNQHAMQRGTGREPAAVAPAPASRAVHNPAPPVATQPGQPDHEPNCNHPLHRGTVRRVRWPFRRALLDGTASSTPEADKLATHAEHVGGWPVIAAAAEAKQAGLDWRPAASAARQHIVDEANRQRARCVFRMAPLPDFVR